MKNNQVFTVFTRKNASFVSPSVKYDAKRQKIAFSSHFPYKIERNRANADNGGSTVKYAKKRKYIEGEISMKIALQDLCTVLKHTSELRISNQRNEYEIIKSFIEILKSVKCIHVKKIILDKFSFNDVITILQYCDTKFLEHIELFGTDMNEQFESVICLDQWKCAKKLYLFDSFLENRQIVHLFHFQWFRIELDDFSLHIAIKIRDDLMRRSTFQGCHINCDRSKSNPIEIAKVFKPDYAGGNEFLIEYSIDNANFVIKCNFVNPYIFWFIVQKL